MNALPVAAPPGRSGMVAVQLPGNSCHDTAPARDENKGTSSTSRSVVLKARHLDPEGGCDMLLVGRGWNGRRQTIDKLNDEGWGESSQGAMGCPGAMGS